MKPNLKIVDEETKPPMRSYVEYVRAHGWTPPPKLTTEKKAGDVVVTSGGLVTV